MVVLRGINVERKFANGARDKDIKMENVPGLARLNAIKISNLVQAARAVVFK